jgi:hypothetical protein
MANTKAEEYRRRAEDCRSRAIASQTPEAQALWHDLSSRWDQSAEKVEELAELELTAEQNERLAA